MHVTPRKDEYGAVVELLESAEYESAEALAKAIVKACYDGFRRREWWSVWYGGHWFDGLEPTEAAIRKWADKQEYPEGRLIAKIRGTEMLKEQREAEGQRLIELERLAGQGPCEACGHGPTMHTRLYTGWGTPKDKPSPGPCLGPGDVPGKSIHPEMAAGYTMCGCKKWS